MEVTMVRLMLLMVVLIEVTSQVASFGANQARCEKITEIPLCVNMRYNDTRMPNLLGHTSQREASTAVHVFLPLVQSKCSPLLLIFLCSIYAPMCTEQLNDVIVVPPCRSMCESVKQGCEPLLLGFDLGWPDVLSCEKLPSKDEMSEELCIQAPPLDQIDLKVRKHFFSPLTSSIDFCHLQTL